MTIANNVVVLCLGDANIRRLFFLLECTLKDTSTFYHFSLQFGYKVRPLLQFHCRRSPLSSFLKRDNPFKKW